MTAAPAPVTDISSARHRVNPWQWVASIVVILLAVGVIRSLATNSTIEWDLVIQYIPFASIVEGMWLTVWLTVVAMALGIAGGIALAAARLSRNLLVRGAADVYVWFFRGTPLLVQLIFWYNAAIFVPTLRIGLPFGGPTLWEASTNDVISPLGAAILGLALNEAAYMCEVVRGGLLSVSPGQTEAAQSLGLSERKTFLQIVLPQAMRAIVPPTGNQVIGMLKGTSLVSVIAVSDLLYSAQALYNNNGKVIPLLVVSCIWYLIATSVLYAIQSRLEKYFGRGTRQAPVRRARLTTLVRRQA